MMTSQDEASTKHDQQQQKSPPTAPPAADVESQSEAAPAATGFGVAGIIRRWKRNDMVTKGGVALRGLSLVLSFLAFVIMASNKHGDWKDFDKYEEYRYLLAIAILATFYSAAQTFKHATGKEMFQRRTSALADFIGDQIMAYLLISSASSAIPLTNRMRESQDNMFTDASASAISMAFLAFVTLALLAVISGHKLSSQSYI
ncbi:CASP-like protein 4B1 [Argentina anserina]|uniref:CASP-like protein 4B1 n=1 Tax=Argentina anserina TaxID=57926 RepID=UPI0021766AF7|nr:CASP-like protein 4B1 [Potentilla anserina]